MPNPIVATVGSAVVGAASSRSAAKKAASAQSAASAQEAATQQQGQELQAQVQREGQAAQADAEAARLAFAQAQYEDWQATYGGIEDNLASYYSSLTPTFFAAQGLEAFEKEQSIAAERVRANLAQRGIEDSGVAAGIETAFATEGAAERATIRAEAPLKAAETKFNFLQAGLGLNPAGGVESALAGNVSGAANRAQLSSNLASSSARTNLAAAQARTSRAAGLADSAAASAGRATQQAVTVAGTALSDYFSK